MWLHDDFLRWLYRGRRASPIARVMNKPAAVASRFGIWPSRAAELVVSGRKSGRDIAFPVVIAEYEGERYIVSMLGERVNWVQNLRAAGGRAVLRHGRAELIRLEEVPVDERAPILQRYLAVAPGARPHIRVDRKAPIAEFARAAPEYPVFVIRPRLDSPP